MNLAELGEFGAIALFRDLLARSARRTPAVEIGIGDDAAVWRPTAGRAAIETTDLLIEQVHFSLRWCTWYDVGWKAMAVNISDIAAMGGRPRVAFVSAGLSPQMSREHALELFRGLAECASQYDIDILGGDTVASPQAAAINVALYGETLNDDGDVLRRDRARPGDAIAVSGPLGASAAFLRHRPGASSGAQGPRTQDETALRAAHLHPRPRVELAQKLLNAGVRCAMDVSDGLLADLGKVCVASSVGARLNAAQVPLAPALRRALPQDALELALTGGEDYELLVCGPATLLEKEGLIVVGDIVPGAGVELQDGDGKVLRYASPGYDAFSHPPSEATNG